MNMHDVSTSETQRVKHFTRAQIKPRYHRAMILVTYIGALTTACESSQSLSSSPAEALDAMTEADMSLMSDAVSTPDLAMSDLGMLDADPVDPPEELGPQGRLVSGVIGRGHWDGIGEEARFDGMVCATLSAGSDHLYVTDAFSGTVRDVDLERREVSTLGGFPYEFAVFDGPLDQARFESPRGCAVSPDGEGVLVADSATLRWISLRDESVTTWAGRAGDLGNQDGSSEATRLGYLTHDIIWAPSGAYAILSDRSNDRIRLFVRETRSTHALGPLIEENSLLRLDGPGGLALTEEGDLLIADTFNGRLIRVNLSDLNLEERLSQAQTDQPLELAFDRVNAEVINDNLNDPQGVATANGLAWVAGFDGEITEVNLMSGETSPLLLDLRANKESALSGAFAPLIYDSLRAVLYYLDIGSESAKEISIETGVVKTVVGPKDVIGDRDGALDLARFGVLYDVVGTDRGWFVADPEYGKVKRIITEGPEAGVTTVMSAPDTAGDLSPERIAGLAPVALAFDEPRGVLYIADLREHVIRSYDLNAGEIAVVAGSVGESGDLDGSGQEARFSEPFGLDFGPDGALYIADAGNRAVKRFNPETGEVTTLARGEIEPFDVLLHNDGELYAVDGNTPVVFKVVDQAFEVVLGDAREAGPGDGESGRFATPIALTRYIGDELLVLDAENHRVRLANTVSGELGTWLGQFTRHGGWGSREPLPWSDLRLQSPNAVARYGDESLVLSDTGVILLSGDPHRDVMR